jgi:hypothetical protein
MEYSVGMKILLVLASIFGLFLMTAGEHGLTWIGRLKGSIQRKYMRVGKVQK